VKLTKKVFIVVNSAWNIVNFRSGIIRALLAYGFEVVAVAPPDKYADRLSDLGCSFVPFPMDNQGSNPVRDLLLLWRLFWLMRSKRPDVFLGYTVKPNVYGSIAAQALGIPVINNIAGLGAVFIRGGVLSQIVKVLYRVALSRSQKVFFQNDDDRQLFIRSRIVLEGATDLLAGSGIDLVRFFPVPLQAKPSLRFLLISRMLWDKGVGEFVGAARLLKKRGVDAEFCLLGFLDVQNPSAISRQQLNDWVEEGAVRYLGVSDHVQEEIAQADCVVLPSYREGTPRALLEAAAMARPLITTDAVGCREVVDDGVNGYLCKIKDTSDLANKMGLIASMSHAQRVAMGLRGREKVELEFDEQKVIDKYLSAIDEVLVTKNR
jgi:glycosyltransferase involved in cell wall biosynthesis